MWEPIAERVMQSFSAGAFTLDGVRYGIYGRDQRSESVLDFIRGNWASFKQGAPATPAPLERKAFDEALRVALRSLDRPDLLAPSPLRRAPFLAACAPTPEALAQLIRDEAERVFGSPRDADLRRVFARAYLEPAAKQDAAAAELGLSPRSYRRYLKAALERLGEALWRRAG